MHMQRIRTMTTIDASLIEQLKRLPPSRVAEVADFVAFLTAREQRAAAAARLGDTFAEIDAQGLPALSEDEIEAEVQADRQARRRGA